MCLEEQGYLTVSGAVFRMSRATWRRKEESVQRCSKGSWPVGQGLQKPARNVPQFVHYTKTTSRRGDSAQHGARSTGKKELLFLITKMPPLCSLTCGNWIQMCSLNTAQRHPDRVQWGDHSQQKSPLPSHVSVCCHHCQSVFLIHPPETYTQSLPCPAAF